MKLSPSYLFHVASQPPLSEGEDGSNNRTIFTDLNNETATEVGVKVVLDKESSLYFESPQSIFSFCSCGTFSCDTLLQFTIVLVWFSLLYSFTRLAFICHFLLQQSDEDEEGGGGGGDGRSRPGPYAIPMLKQLAHRRRIGGPVKKHCLWETVGMLLIAYETILSFILCVGTGSLVFKVKGFFVLMWCLNYPVFLIFHWVLGFFLTKCLFPYRRMKHASVHNCTLVVVNIAWRGLLYWCALNLLFHHPKVRGTAGGAEKELEIFRTFASASASTSASTRVPKMMLGS